MAERKKTLPRLNIRNAPPPYNEFIGERADESEYFYFADGEGQPCADRIPFRLDARGVDLVNAWWLCEAATLAYSGRTVVEGVLTNKTPLKQVEFLNTGGGTECFVASNEDLAIVAFRGSELTPREENPHDFSEILKDWLRNADIRTLDSDGGGKVHRGFADGIDRLWREKNFGQLIAGLPSREVWFTGHSLGAALATVAAARVLAENGRVNGLYTYGSPRVGDEDFADALRAKLADDRLVRFVNGNDVVTAVPRFSKLRLSVPPRLVAFKHVGALKHIDRDGRITDDQSKFDQLKESVVGLLTGDVGVELDRLFNGIPNAVEDHVPTLYSTHIWNAYVEEQGGGD